MTVQSCKLIALLVALVAGAALFAAPRISAAGGNSALDDQLSAALGQHGFTGRVGSSLEQRLGRKIDHQLATPVVLSNEEFDQLIVFLRTGLQNPRATPHNLRKLIPKSLPSGLPVPHFQ